MLPVVVLLSGSRLASTGATCWLSPSARTAVSAIKDDYFLCLVSAKSFRFICSQGGGGGQDSDVISTVI